MSSDLPGAADDAGHRPAPGGAAGPLARPSDRRRFLMRYTIVDAGGSISFVGPCQGLKPLVAACAEDVHQTAEALLAAAGAYDSELRDSVLNGLHVFDEHNVPGDYGAIRAAVGGDKARQPDSPVFRVVDEVTREASLQPVKAGLVLFNLRQKRIIQIQNTYAEVRREDTGRVRRGGRETGRFYRYRLPPGWQLIP